LVVLKLVESNAVDPNVRFAAVLLFKNFIKRQWPQVRLCDRVSLFVQVGDADTIAVGDRMALKAQIVGLMIAVPEKLQLQLSDAVSIMAAHDFPQLWDTLIAVRFCDLLIEKLTLKRIWCQS
jgi:exportin-2 (importin alpha re-exporter)